MGIIQHLLRGEKSTQRENSRLLLECKREVLKYTKKSYNCVAPLLKESGRIVYNDTKGQNCSVSCHVLNTEKEPREIFTSVIQYLRRTSNTYHSNYVF